MQILIILVMAMLPASSVLNAAIIYYGGFAMVKNPVSGDHLTDRYCMAILESSPYTSQMVIYSYENIKYLTDNKPDILNHIQKKSGVNLESLWDSLETKYNKKQDSNCLSSEDLSYWAEKFGNLYPSKKLQRNMRHHFFPMLSRLKQPTYPGPSLWSEDVFDAYVIRKYSDPLEQADQYWRPTDQPETDKTLIASEKPSAEQMMMLAHRFILNYKNLGKIKKIKKTADGSFHQDRKDIFPSLDWIRDKTLKLKEIKSQKKIKALFSMPRNKLKQYTKTDDIRPLTYLDQYKKKSAIFRKKLLQKLSDYQIKKLKDFKSSTGRKNTLAEYYKLKSKKPLTRSEKTLFKDLKAEIEFGIRPKENSAKGKLRLKIKKALKFYNVYGTDTIVDKFMVHSFRFSLKQLLPMSKKRYILYRLSKGADGLFVFITTTAALVGAPITGGLSLPAAAGINVLTTGIFSVLTSATRYEPLSSNLYRLGLRSVHTFGESFIPVWTEFNGYFTSIDDLRVALNLDLYLTNIIKNQKRALKVRPESLGKPVVLCLLEERINYLESKLLPHSLRHLSSGELTKKQMNFIIQTISRLQTIYQKLFLRLVQSVFRYESLIIRGKIPDHMIYDVTSHLRRWERLHRQHKHHIREWAEFALEWEPFLARVSKLH